MDYCRFDQKCLHYSDWFQFPTFSISFSVIWTPDNVRKTSIELPLFRPYTASFLFCFTHPRQPICRRVLAEKLCLLFLDFEVIQKTSSVIGMYFGLKILRSKCSLRFEKRLIWSFRLTEKNVKDRWICNENYHFGFVAHSLSLIQGYSKNILFCFVRILTDWKKRNQSMFYMELLWDQEDQKMKISD